jgi:hypothetical protein
MSLLGGVVSFALWSVTGVALLVALAAVALRLVFASRRSRHRAALASSSPIGPSTTTVAFLHPYANSGGGGERVLWLAVQALAQSGKDVHVTIYTGDPEGTEDAIFRRTFERFGVQFDTSSNNSNNTGNIGGGGGGGARAIRRPTFVWLSRRRWIEAASWPRFTMLGQSLGSMVLAMEALLAFTPDVFVDTTGLAFSLPVAWLLAGCRTAAYVHYPTISTDMLRSVVDKRPSYNNASAISSRSVSHSVRCTRCFGVGGGCPRPPTRARAFMLPFTRVCHSLTTDCRTPPRLPHFLSVAPPPLPLVLLFPSRGRPWSLSLSGLLTRGKLVYYHLFAFLYRLVGRCCHVVMANSTWTSNHIKSLWGKATVVYPPCDVSTFKKFELAGRRRVVVSVSQYVMSLEQPVQRIVE